GSIVGYATLTASELSTSLLPVARRKRLPRYPVPVLRLARLAVDERARGRGAGSVLLRFVLVLAHRMAVDFGCAGVVVDAKPEAVAFYEKLDFVALGVRAGQLGDRPEPLPMFLAIGSIPGSET
ncbi:MAG TPA: GNAT family N-acetyltransferase, partial [Myxococcales bacterium]|nr:GNAT family N-acetyltransferase [Myxococcales bacterium]